MIVKVIAGKQRLQFDCSVNMTFGQLRLLTEEKTGTIEGGLRLLHRGKAVSDQTSLADGKIESSPIVMALPSQKQREENKKKEKEEKEARLAKSMNELQQLRATASASSAKAVEASSQKVIKGDAEIDGRPFVFLLQGRDKFRVNIELSATVGELKQKAALLDGVNTSPKEMKMILKGRVLKESDVLRERGAKKGSPLMLLFSAKHHDKRSAEQELESIKGDLPSLKKLVSRYNHRVEHRLLDAADALVEKSQLEQRVSQLSNRLESIECDESERKAIEDELDNMRTSLM